MPPRHLRRRRRAAVAPVQTDEVLRLEGEERRTLTRETGHYSAEEGNKLDKVGHLEKIVEVSQDFRREGNVRSHQPQLHRHTR